VDEDGYPLEGDLDSDVDPQEIPNSSLRIIPHCHMGERYLWDLGSVTRPDAGLQDGGICVIMGPHTMVHSASIPILHLATGGRMSLQRYWRLLMHKGFSEGSCIGGVPGIDYGEISDGQDQTPYPTPGLCVTELRALEDLRHVESIKKAIIHQGKFWVWMRPDR
jgi:hypothetical protein